MPALSGDSTWYRQPLFSATYLQLCHDLVTSNLLLQFSFPQFNHWDTGTHPYLALQIAFYPGKFLDQGPLPAFPSLSIFFRTMPVITKEVLGPHLTCMGHCSSSRQFLLEDKEKSVSDTHWQKPTKAIQPCATVPRRGVPSVQRLQLPSA